MSSKFIWPHPPDSWSTARMYASFPRYLITFQTFLYIDSWQWPVEYSRLTPSTINYKRIPEPHPPPIKKLI